MIILRQAIVLHLLVLSIKYSAAQWCTKYQPVVKTRIHWYNGQRMITKKTIFGTKYSYEPYVYSSTDYYNDHERILVCCDGFAKKDNDVCEPICENPLCPANSQCIQPNVCKCLDGYMGLGRRPDCRPICFPKCPENSKCTAPGVCSCNDGYRKSTEDSCEPLCPADCPDNAECLKPNQCSCKKGYVTKGLLDGSPMQCEAECKPQCPLNGKCVEPNKCSCLEGYKMEDNQCKPACNTPCVDNAFCKAPNQCDCHEGYEWGKTAEDSWECLPKCEDECPENGFCSRPNNCECKEGYEMSSNHSCQPVCQSSCPENSLCGGPNKCLCLEGYQSTVEGGQCQPFCEHTCPQFSQCSKPNHCECLPGYHMKMSSNHSNFCEPQCQRNCSTFGKCVEPNKCECLPGYEMDEMETCIAICSHGCLNGLCYRPEVCICNTGFLMGPNNQCRPQCSQPCHNGLCVEPDICQCLEGYKFQEGSVHNCEPICEPPCVNGICMGPNICFCNDNYEPQWEKGELNHNHCQLSKITTAKEDYMQAEISPSTAIDNLSTAPPLQSCLDLCQCWEEYDEFGSLVSAQPQCVHPCADPYDKPCLNFSLCQCEASKPQLLCQPENDPEEEALIYTCKISRIMQASTTTKSPGTVEMKSTAIESNHSSHMWPIVAATIGTCSLLMIGFVIYRKFLNQCDRIPEYEL